MAYPSYFTSFCYHSFMFFLDQYGYAPRKNKLRDNKSTVMYERKKMFVMLYVLTNSMIGLICFFLTNRTSRVITIEVLGIVGGVFNGVRMIAIVISVIRMYVKKKQMMNDEEWNEESTEIRGSVLGGLFMPSEGIDLKPTLKSEIDTPKNSVLSNKSDKRGSFDKSLRKGITMFDDGEKKSINKSTKGKKGLKKEKSNERNESSEIGPGMRRKQKSSTVKKVV